MEKEKLQDLMLYWKPATAEDLLKRRTTNKSVTSDQLWRASLGDTVWVVTVEDGELFLLNRLYVGEVTNRMDAIKKLGASGIWGDTEYYAIALAGKEEPLKKISLGGVTDKLAFQSENAKSRKLNIFKGRVDPRQLQTMRILDDSTVGLLNRIWTGTYVT
ncbi:hypothetical protein ACFLUB_04495 [Chloroflexota bacterium]